MKKATTSPTDVCIDLTEPWEVSAHLLEALASFDKVIAQIEGASCGNKATAARDLGQVA